MHPGRKKRTSLAVLFTKVYKKSTIGFCPQLYFFSVLRVKLNVAAAGSAVLDYAYLGDDAF